MTYNITLTANHQSLTAEYLPLAAESVQYLTAKVVCETEDWTGREIKAMFGQGCTVYEVPVTGGEITAKQQLNLTAGDWRVWLVGNSARDGEVIPRITTNVAHISVAPTGGTEGSPFPTIPPTAEERLRADMGNLADLTTEDKSSLVAAINEVRQTGGVQSDWNQNDETQPDYVKNRPFYTGGPVETVLVEESTVSFAEDRGLYIARFPSTFEATVGETYKVYWDGAAYECACVNLDDILTIGNLSIIGAGSDTGEPFIIGISNNDGTQIATADTSASHTVSISIVSSVVKIDGKYLPNTVATKSEVEVAQTTARNAQTAASNAQATASNAQTTARNAQTTANNAQTTANNAQDTANNAQATANNAKSEALDLAARMFGHTSVVDNAFDGDKTLSITSLPACIESIGVRAFDGCTNLALTSLPSGLTSIGNSAFHGCTNLALTSLPSGLTSIDNGAFSGCTKLALTSLPSGLTSIGFQVFGGCKNLALTSLPSGLTSIDSHAFDGCTKLALTSLPSGITRIGTNAFAGCFKLVLTSLPSGITSIGSSAFYNCTKLTSITFTGTPTSIGSSAFSGCTNLTTINVPWAEGEVANAPWGATNATINYNYTGA